MLKTLISSWSFPGKSLIPHYKYLILLMGDFNFEAALYNTAGIREWFHPSHVNTAGIGNGSIPAILTQQE